MYNHTKKAATNHPEFHYKEIKLNAYFKRFLPMLADSSPVSGIPISNAICDTNTKTNAPHPIQLYQYNAQFVC